MLIRIITGILIVLGGDAAAAHGVAAGDERSADFDPKATLPYFQVRDETARDALIRLGDAHGFFFCIEDPKGGSGASPRRLSMELRDRSIESIVEAILDRDGGYSWTMDGDILNVISRELAAGNPFESTIEGFRFKGTTDEFLQKASSLVAMTSVRVPPTSVSIGRHPPRSASRKPASGMTVRSKAMLAISRKLKATVCANCEVDLFATHFIHNSQSCHELSHVNRAVRAHLFSPTPPFTGRK